MDQKSFDRSQALLDTSSVLNETMPMGFVSFSNDLLNTSVMSNANGKPGANVNMSFADKNLSETGSVCKSQLQDAAEEVFFHDQENQSSLKKREQKESEKKSELYLKIMKEHNLLNAAAPAQIYAKPVEGSKSAAKARFYEIPSMVPTPLKDSSNLMPV